MKREILLATILLTASVASLKDASAATTALKICANTTKGTLTARTKCKKGETRLTLSSFTGPAGATGARGLSAFDEIPSGTTVYGVIGFDGDDAGSGHDWYGFASLPAKTTQILTNDDVIVANNINVDNNCQGGSGACLTANELSASSQCTGSYPTPTAPAGKVCIYISLLSYAGISSGTIEAYVVSDIDAGMTNTPGFMVRVVNSAPGDVYIRGIWAYTAP